MVLKRLDYDSVTKPFCVPDKKNCIQRVKKVFGLKFKEMKFSKWEKQLMFMLTA